MSGVLQLLALVVVASVATFLLERGGRLGYGWVTGSEFLVAGVLLGPVGLDIVSGDLLLDARVLIVIGGAWLGMRVGLRLCRTEVAEASARNVLASQLEPIVALFALRGLLELARTRTSFPLASWDAWLLSAVGATTTKSALAWVRSRHHAQGRLSDSLSVITDLNDLPSVFLVGVLFALRPETHTALGGGPGMPLGVTALLALGVALLVFLVAGMGTFRVDVAWVALMGAGALVSGASGPLGLRAVVVGSLSGILLGLISPHRDRFEELTRPTERPVVQVLMVLGGASIPLLPSALVAGLAFAGLRLLAKGFSGLFVGALVRPSGSPEPMLGLGLFGGGGTAFALSLTVSLALPEGVAAVVLSSAAAMVVLGDVVGATTLKWILRLRQELPLPPDVARPGTTETSP